MENQGKQILCPLCHSVWKGLLLPHKGWKSVPDRFCLCGTCDLAFVRAELHLSTTQEEARYRAHQNELTNPGFYEFLMQTVLCLRQQLPAPLRVLDFGSGPLASMTELLRREGYVVTVYDPYFPKTDLQGPIDVILLHEVFEHLHDPRKELQVLRAQLAPGGCLVVRTELRPEDEALFSNWSYARDATHITLCSEKTLQWISQMGEFSVQKWSEVLFCLTPRVVS